MNPFPLLDGADNDVHPRRIIPESVPTGPLDTNRWALVEADDILGTTQSTGGGPDKTFCLSATAGFS